MSYFDDASLAFLASGAAGKDGKAYSIKPVPVYGPELVTNGDFATDSDWTKEGAWTISNSVASVTSSGNDRIYQSVSLDASKKYLLSVNVISISSASIRFRFGAQGSASNLSEITTPGIHTFETEPLSGTSSVGLFAVSGTTAIIDNVSVKEVIISDGDFTFTRGSNLSATRVNASQLIEKGRENLLLQSNQFDTTWVSGSSTLTSGQSGYDGTSDAWLLTKTSASGNIYQGKSYSGVNTFSIYAKGNTANWIRLRNTGAYVYFDVTNGVVGGNINAISPSITSVGSGWYRCEVAWNGTGTITQVFVADSDGSTSGTSGSVYIQDSQLESSLVATSVIETGASTAQAGILENTPRFDYSGGATCPSLLLEPSRSNLLPQSEYFNTWTALLNVTLSPNATTSPEGLLNATKLVEDSATAIHRIYQIVSITSGQAYTQSVFAKEGERRYLQIAFGSKISGTDYANFDLQIGEVSLEVGSINATIEPYGNGWYRCSATSTANVTSSEAFYYTIVESGSASRFASYSGDGTSGAYIFGAQVEAGYATSYIPTYGVSQTRASDDVNELTGATSLIGQSEGTMFLDFVANDDDALQIIYQVRTTGSTNVGQVDFRIQSGLLRALGNNGGTNQFNISAGAAVAGTRYKCAVRYATNDVAFYVNGVLKGTDTSASFGSSSLNQIGFNENTGGFFPSVNVKQALLFKTPLSNAELATLTTI
mgnify:CR=1 FL=1